MCVCFFWGGGVGKKEPARKPPLNIGGGGGRHQGHTAQASAADSHAGEVVSGGARFRLLSLENTEPDLGINRIHGYLWLRTSPIRSWKGCLNLSGGCGLLIGCPDSKRFREGKKQLVRKQGAFKTY